MFNYGGNFGHLWLMNMMHNLHINHETKAKKVPFIVVIHRNSRNLVVQV